MIWDEKSLTNASVQSLIISFRTTDITKYMWLTAPHSGKLTSYKNSIYAGNKKLSLKRLFVDVNRKAKLGSQNCFSRQMQVPTRKR
jgi:hypothetical protein